jgi:curved DNA-binding protein CbpA
LAKLRTHYDNLKVARDAPIEVIRAAYRSLSQKYHPDKNKDNPRAAEIMAIINASYTVLSDPEKRKEHDAWIAGMERSGKASSGFFRESRGPASPAAPKTPPHKGPAPPSASASHGAGKSQQGTIVPFCTHYRLLDISKRSSPDSWSLHT